MSMKQFSTNCELPINDNKTAKQVECKRNLFPEVIFLKANSLNDDMPFPSTLDKINKIN